MRRTNRVSCGAACCRSRRNHRRRAPRRADLPRFRGSVCGSWRRHRIERRALPSADGIVISLQRMRKIVEIDPRNLRAVVEPGVTNVDITKAAAPFGLHFAPDPSSQQVCTVGGNVAENSGGAHCLKYGFTVHHVLELEVVLPDGSVARLGESIEKTLAMTCYRLWSVRRAP